MAQRPLHVLFLCTGNSARSILAESLLNHLGKGRFIAHSAGSQPTGKVNPLALTTLRNMQVPVQNPRSKSWNKFARSDGHTTDMDIIITVCDNAAGEVCPIWPGHPVTAHWGVSDPAAVEGSEPVKLQAFHRAARTLKARIQGLIALPLEELDGGALRRKLNDLGALQDASTTP